MAIIDTLQKISDTVWELPASYKQGMRVPARIIATEKLVREMDEAVYQQISNVATLPGITRYALCMADGHSGYGFPIGGVAAMDVHQGGVISPGGIGFDINCGMRLVTTNLTVDDVQPHLKEIVDRLFERVPAGVGTHSVKKAWGAATKGKRASGSEHTRDASGRHSLAPGLRSLWIRVDRLPKAGTSLSLSWSRSGCQLRTPYT
jgi:RNA-splicing ligase RtcB